MHSYKKSDKTKMKKQNHIGYSQAKYKTGLEFNCKANK